MGVRVQTLRLATPPFPVYLGDKSDEEILRFAKEIEAGCLEQGFDYCSLGSVEVSSAAQKRFLPLLPRLIAETSSVFSSAVLLRNRGRLKWETALAVAQVIRRIAQETEGGFGNLRFAALVNCPPHIPFFPAAYHSGEDSFAFALQAADIVRTVCRSGADWEQIAEELREEIERQVLPLQRIGEDLEEAGILYRGVDLSPAPGPEPEESIAYALESLGNGRFGEPGTLAAAGFLTSVLKSTQLRTCGYCGLMLPVLEDYGLAERNNQGLLNLTSLLAYSAVCGTGLDTIPLPGDASEPQLGAVLRDVAALGEKLDKPLSARLFPIPGKQAGDWTEFHFPYFVNTKVMALL
jgi:hypothetical protein